MSRLRSLLFPPKQPDYSTTANASGGPHSEYAIARRKTLTPREMLPPVPDAAGAPSGPQPTAIPQRPAGGLRTLLHKPGESPEGPGFQALPASPARPATAVEQQAAITPVTAGMPRSQFRASILSPPSASPVTMPIAPRLAPGSPTPNADAITAKDPVIQSARAYGTALQNRPLTAGAPTNEQAAQTFGNTQKAGRLAGLPGFQSNTTVGGAFGQPAADRAPYNQGAALDARTPIEGALVRSGNTQKYLDGAQDSAGGTWKLNPATGKVEKQPEQVTSPSPEAFAAAQAKVDAIQGNRSQNPTLHDYLGNTTVRPGAMQDGGASFTTAATPASQLYAPLAERMKRVQANAAEDAQARQDRVRVSRGGLSAMELAAKNNPQGMWGAMAAKMRADAEAAGAAGDRDLRREENVLRKELGLGELKVKGEALAANREESRLERALRGELAKGENASREKIAGLKTTEPVTPLTPQDVDPIANEMEKNGDQEGADQLRREAAKNVGVTVKPATPTILDEKRIRLRDVLRKQSPAKTLGETAPFIESVMTDGNVTDEERKLLEARGIDPEVLARISGKEADPYFPGGGDSMTPLSILPWLLMGESWGDAKIRKDRKSRASKLRDLLQQPPAAAPVPNAAAGTPLRTALGLA